MAMTSVDNPAIKRLLPVVVLCLSLPLHHLSTSSQSPYQASQTPQLKPTNHPSTSITMSSNVGSSSTYEAGDQRTVSDAEIKAQQEANRFHEGKENSHKANDSSMFRRFMRPIHQDQKADIGHRGRAFHCQPARA
jgi:hypothetical protein